MAPLVAAHMAPLRGSTHTLFEIPIDHIVDVPLPYGATIGVRE